MTRPFQICIFEDNHAKQLTPYQLTRPIYTIPNGIYNLVQRIQAYAPETSISLMCQKNQEIFLKKRFPQFRINILNKSLPTLYINGRSNFTIQQFNSILNDITFDKNSLFINNKSITAIYSTDSLNAAVFNLLTQSPSFDDVVQEFRPHCQVKEKKHLPFVQHWWDFIAQFAENISSDFDLFPKKSLIEGDVSSFSVLNNDQNIFVDVTSKISEYVSLDATNGPIIIMGNVTVKPFSRIEGPCFIGPGTTIQPQAVIGSTYIGEQCKVGGEVKNTIIQSFSNKAHHGFIGDSLIGEWVNIGAGTTTSNLKLSYGTIQSISPPTNTTIDTKLTFLGSVFGDYVKTSIHSQFDCGSVIGNACSLHGAHTHSKFIPPFTWGEKNTYLQQNIAAFLTSLNRMMNRRNRQLTDEESHKLKTIYDQQRELNAVP